MSQELAVPDNWQVLQQKALTLIRSGFLPKAIDTPEKALAIIITGKELGVPMMEALRGINIIMGKPSVSGQLMLALARRTGELENFKVSSDEDGATCVVKRKGEDEHTSTFTKQNAVDMQLFTRNSDNYTKQPQVMFKWRAISQALRFTFPDAIAGLYTKEEMAPERVTVDGDGDMQLKEEPKPAVRMPEAIEAQAIPSTGGEFGGVDEFIPPEVSEVFGEVKVRKEFATVRESATRISEKQRKYLWVMLRKAGVSDGDFLHYMQTQFKKEQSDDLTNAELQKCLIYLSSNPKR